MSAKKLKTELGLIEKLSKIINGAYSSYVEYDYDRTSCGGGCDDYCRCTMIINSRINSVDINGIVNDICNDNEVLKYCVNRILTHSGLRDTNNWELNVGHGYYGQEVDGARFSGEVPIDALKKLLANKNNNAEMVKTALIQEYGYLLSDVENVDFDITSVALNDISIGQEAHYRRLDQNIVKQYKDFELPLAICLSNGNGKFRLIDGYHRLAAARVAGKDNVRIILGSKNE